jgi:hypothetical protein
MKMLVIPDIHNRIGVVDKILATEKGYDKVIFLGDYFDGFGDTPSRIREVAEWLKPKLWDDNFICLYGNHDISYFFGQICSGWSYPKNEVIHSVLAPTDFKRLNFFWQAQGWLFTHAGLHPMYLPPTWKESTVTTRNLKNYLMKETEDCLTRLQIGGEHWFYRCGDSRRYQPLGIKAGGILWCDVREEFEPVPNIRQIFGHTPSSRYPILVAGNLKRMSGLEVLTEAIAPKNGWDVCLDCHLAYYGVLDDGALTIKPSPSV